MFRMDSNVVSPASFLATSRFVGNDDFGFVHFICMSMLPFCRHVYQMHACYQQSLEEDVRSFATRVTDGWELPSGFWKPKPM